MNREEYKMMAELILKVPPKTETPDGQKFHIGEIVRIANPKNWYAKRFKPNQLFQIKYSYAQKYGSLNETSKNEYSLKHLFEDNSSSWYNEIELELVKSITEITEEQDLKEYERLKQKYDRA